MRTNYFKNLILPVLFLAMAPSMSAQIMPWENRTDDNADPFAKTTGASNGTLHLEDVVGGRLINARGAGRLNWLKDGERYSRLEPNSATGGQDVVAYRAKDNKREVIIPSTMFKDKESGKIIPIRSLTWSDDNNKVLVYTNTRKVWRYDTRGDYWVLDLKTGDFHQLGKGMPESSLMFAKFSPDATRVAYVSGNNIYVENISDGTITPAPSDGNDRIVNVTFDWVYE